MSSVQFPIPVSRSGVRLAATMPGVSAETSSEPDPSFPGTGGQPGRLGSDGPWQAKHSPIPLTRYLPRARRSGVRPNVRFVRGRTLVPAELLAGWSRDPPCRDPQPTVDARATVSSDLIPARRIATAAFLAIRNVVPFMACYSKLARFVLDTS